MGILFKDFGQQIQKSLKIIAKEGKGLLLYMRHSEKGQSILDHLKTLAKQNHTGNIISTDPSNSIEQRDYGVGAQILRDLNITKMRLITDHPKRRIGLIGYGLEIVENVDLNA